MRKVLATYLLVGSAGAALLLSCSSYPKGGDTRAGSKPKAPATAEAFLSTEFRACERRTPTNPSPAGIDVETFSRLLHGVWVGNRTLREGKAETASYALLFDAEAREGLAFEERGPGVAANAFARALPVAATSAPRITYFYCGGSEFGAFKDEFVKVSDDPRQGLRSLGEVTNTRVSDASIFDAWSTLRKMDFFTRPLDGALRNTAFYTISLVPVEGRRPGASRVRLDLVGQYRGSPEKFVRGQPVAGLEGGTFEGHSTDDGLYLVGQQVAVLCFCDPTRVDWEKGTPLTNFSYDKVVIGPLQP